MISREGKRCRARCATGGGATAAPYAKVRREGPPRSAYPARESPHIHIPAKTRCCAERLVLDWQPFRAPQVKRWTACPLCSATGEQTCSNCLGTGVVVPL